VIGHFCGGASNGGFSEAAGQQTGVSLRPIMQDKRDSG